MHGPPDAGIQYHRDAEPMVSVSYRGLIRVTVQISELWQAAGFSSLNGGRCCTAGAAPGPLRYRTQNRLMQTSTSGMPAGDIASCRLVEYEAPRISGCHEAPTKPLWEGG
ncbi:hypothetical protein RE2895_60340 (plasmid) [Rhodococcus erythropolis]|nr:hypothetical protein RE2895_60340 [Rhodococcus erythropolis]